jgi:hypothetical protein
VWRLEAKQVGRGISELSEVFGVHRRRLHRAFMDVLGAAMKQAVQKLPNVLLDAPFAAVSEPALGN